MKIVRLQAENIKRIRAIEITPTGNLVEITGRNGQGKTSVLDAIWWALCGTKPIQAQPIRKGAKSATVTLDLGEYVVRRTFHPKDGNEFTTSLAVETADGARLRSPQTLLDGFLGSLTIDPLAFSRKDARGQFDALKAFVPGVDFDKIAAQDRGDFSRRTDLNRAVKEKRAAAGLIDVPEHFEPIDEQAILDRLTDVAEENDRIAERRRRREAVAESVQRDTADAERLRANAADLMAQAQKAIADAEVLEAKVEADKQRLAAAPKLPDPVDAADLKDQLGRAREHNAKGARVEERRRLLAEAEQIEADAQKLTDAMAAREESKRAAIAAAKLPVDGLEFGDGHILLNGVPFEQASDAERLRASIAIAMASAPALRVIRVRDGSLLDEDAMALLATMADAADCQVWIETVGGGSTSGFVIEDGSLADHSMRVAAE